MFHFPKHHKPTEANISSMSSWWSRLVAWEVASYVVLFLGNSVLFFSLFSRFSLTPALNAEDLNRLLIEWKRVLWQAFVLNAAEDWQVLGTDPWGDKAQHTSCLKVFNFLWNLEMRRNSYRDNISYKYVTLLKYVVLPQQFYTLAQVCWAESPETEH